MSQIADARAFVSIRETGEIIEIEEFESVESTLSTLSMSMATMQLLNNADRWYFLKSKADRRQIDISQYLIEIFDMNLVTELHRARRDAAARIRNQAAGRKRGKISITQAERTIQIRQEYVNLTVALELQLMHRVWIDYRGRTLQFSGQQTQDETKSDIETWFAGFTGFISNISDQFIAGRNASLSIGCKDIRRIWQLTKFVTREGLKVLNPTVQDRVARLSGAVENNLSEFDDGASIIRFMLQFVNDVYHPVDEKTGLASQEFYRGTKFWNLPNFDDANEKFVRREYRGFNNVRGLEGFDKISGKEPIRFNDSERTGIRRTPSVDLDYMVSQFSVDPAVLANTRIQSNPYVTMIRKTFNLGHQRMPVNTILDTVVRATFYEIFVDASGNVIYQKPRYDDLPGTNTDILAPVVSSDRPFVQKDEAFDFDGKSGLSIQFHGANYILGDESLLSWMRSEDETAVYTHVVVPSVLNFDIAFDEVINQLGLTGYAAASEEDQFIFGVRDIHTNQVITEQIDQKTLNAYAAAFLETVNARKETATFTLSQRPDLQVGRTLFLYERERLYYIVGLTNRLVAGQAFDTIVTGAYGHDPAIPIGDPVLKAEFGQKQRFEVEQFLAGTESRLGLAAAVKKRFADTLLNVDKNPLTDLPPLVNRGPKNP